MKPASDADTFAEGLMTAPLRVLRWASPAAGSRRDGKASALGCLNPLTLLKFALLLAIIVLMPLFMLPSLLVRLVTVGRSSIRFRRQRSWSSRP